MADKNEAVRKQGMAYYGFGPEAMKKLKVCTECGASSPKDRQFCTECGRRLPDKTLYDIYKERHRSCPACDTVLSESMIYCPQCGTRVEIHKDNILKERNGET